MSGSGLQTAAQYIWTDLLVGHRLQVNWSLGYPQQVDIVSYPIPTEHSHILRYTIRNEGFEFFTQLGRWLEQWLQAKTMRDHPSSQKYLQVCLRIKVPAPHRPRFIHSFAVVVKCFSIYLMNFLLQCSKSLKQESNPSMRTKNSVRVILQESSIHH